MASYSGQAALSLFLQTGAGGVELGLERLAAGDLGGQRLGIGLRLGVGRLGTGSQVGDVGGELGAQLLRPVVVGCGTVR